MFFKTSQRFVLGFFISAVFCALVPRALGKPLTEEAIRHAKRIVIYTGTFDPVHESHWENAEAAHERAGADLIIFAPLIGQTHKHPEPLLDRLNMIRAVAKDSPYLAYPDPTQPGLFNAFKGLVSDDYTPEFAQLIRRLNPHVELDVLLGSDLVTNDTVYFKVVESSIHPDKYLVRTRGKQALETADLPVAPDRVVNIGADTGRHSSTEVRAILHLHPEWYKHPPPRAMIETLGLRPETLGYILSNGIYLPHQIVRWGRSDLDTKVKRRTASTNGNLPRKKCGEPRAHRVKYLYTSRSFHPLGPDPSVVTL